MCFYCVSEVGGETLCEEKGRAGLGFLGEQFTIGVMEMGIHSA